MLVGIGAVPQNTSEFVEYQKAQGGALPMHPHGHPDPSTLINAGEYSPDSYWSRNQTAYLNGAAKGSTFVRDLQGVSNQVPQWFWIAAGSICVAMGYLAYRKKAKRRS